MAGLILATAMAGVILVVAGALRAGRLIALVPEAVIDGFTIGIATIIAASQFQDALGLSAGQVPADMIPKMQALWAVRGTLSLTALGLTAATVAAILLLRRWRSEEHTSELQSLMRISYAVFCLKKKKQN